MLDKEVIKYSRDGVIKKNLATGQTELVTQSDYAKEMKYHPVREKTWDHSSGERPAEEDHKKAPKALKQTKINRSGRNGAEEEKQALAGKTTYNTRPNRSRPATGTTSPGKPPGAVRREARSSTGRKSVESRYTASDQKAGSPHAPVKSRYGSRFHQSLGKRIFHASKDHIFHSEDEKEENPGLQAAGTALRMIQRLRSGARTISNIRSPKSQVFRGTERTASTTVKTVAKKAAGLLKHPAVAKFLLLAAAVLLGLITVCMLLGGILEAFAGSTTEHPELTGYVEQLDNDFLAKIDALKTDYEKKSNTTVSIVGDESVATDPNALAILATGEWTVMDLTPENKEKLAKCHAVLNTYTVASQDKTVTETTTNPDGTATKTQKTVHHVTIQVRVYTAEERLDHFGFTAKQKQDVSEQLSLLNAISTGMIGNNSGANITVGDGEFAWPLPGHTYISSGYGSRVDPITGKAGAFHTGLDIPAPTGTPVLASAGGTVIYSGVKGGYGNCVIIQHENGIQTLYGHNSELDVKKGDKVTQGQVIAKVGQTGRATGPHCHFEFRVNGQHVDPAPYLHPKQNIS
ncbi:hypothetical protein A7X67_11030 [Clostridium sp. W14A]|nr:hypothetical protein A7X67_11030 [Clostridium sp. W14A]